MTEPRLGPPPVEKMSDVAWARVERNVFSRLADGTVTNAAAAREVKREGRSNWFWLAVPGAAAAAFALAFFSMNGTTPQTADKEPSRVVAGASPSTVSFGDAHVTLEANTAVVLDEKAGKPSALLEQGNAVFAVAPSTSRRPFMVLAGDATIRTMTAKFRVSRDGEHAKVVVDTGSVDIRFRGNDVKVEAAGSWSSDRPSE